MSKFKIGDKVRTKKSEHGPKLCQKQEPPYGRCLTCGMFNKVSMEVLDIDLSGKEVYIKMPFKLGCGPGLETV